VGSRGCRRSVFREVVGVAVLRRCGEVVGVAVLCREGKSWVSPFCAGKGSRGCRRSVLAVLCQGFGNVCFHEVDFNGGAPLCHRSIVDLNTGRRENIYADEDNFAPNQ